MTRRARLAVLAVYLVIVLAWEAYGRANYQPGSLVPPPSTVLQVLWDERSVFGTNLVVTLEEAALGFAGAVVLGVAIAVFVDRFRRLGEGVYRVALALYSIPVIALAPVLVTWLGLGTASKAAMALLASFFPVVVNLAQALRATDQRLLELGAVLGTSRLQALRLIRLPLALPALMAALKIAGPSAFIAALIAEWVGAEQGLGLQLLYAMFSFQVPDLWASLAVATAVSALVFLGFDVLARLVTPWHASAAAGREARP